MAFPDWNQLARKFAVEPRWLTWDRRCVQLIGFSFVNRAFEEAAGSAKRPVLLLTTRHHRSGRERTVVLPYYTDEGRAIVVGSHGGRPNDAIWAINLRAHPEVRIRPGFRWRDVKCHEAEGDERQRLWKRITHGGDYLHYEKTAAPRIIPLMIFTPR